MVYKDVIENILKELKNNKKLAYTHDFIYDSEIDAICTYFTRCGYKIGYIKQEIVKDYKHDEKIKNIIFKVEK